MPKIIRVGVIDDQPLFLDGVVDVLKAQSNMEVVGRAGPIRDAVQLTQENDLDVIIVGVTLLDDRIEAFDAIVSQYPLVRILVLSDSSDDERIGEAIARGISGYLPRSTSGSELVDAVRALNQGIGCVSPTLAGRLLMLAHQGSSNIINPEDRFITLTPREKQIVSMLAVGFNNKEIGNKLGINEGTVKYYVTGVLSKLRVRNRVEAALLARTHGIVWQASDDATPQFDTTPHRKITGVSQQRT
jgi:DNA-binding NarL/FixJ family response regulator